MNEIYQSVDEALGRLVAALPAQADVIVLSPSGMGPNTSRSHLLPAMLDAILSEGPRTAKSNGSGAGSSLWRIRCAVPTTLRRCVADVLPDRWAVELAALLELRGVNWSRTRAFMLPNDDAGYVRINLRGRERYGVVEPADADALLDRIATGLATFRNPDGCPTVRKVTRVSELRLEGARAGELPDLIVHWSGKVVSPLAGASSPVYGKVSSPGWGTGRTGCHTGDAWALLLPRSSRLRTPVDAPHVLDVAATVCAVLGVDCDRLAGQPWLVNGS